MSQTKQENLQSYRANPKYSGMTILEACAAHVEDVYRGRRRSVSTSAVVCIALALVSIVFFLTYGALDAWALLGRLRAVRLLGLVVVAVALVAATAVFQTITRNRILSPSVMGFDSMYALLATASVFFLGSATVSQIPNVVLFALQTIIMAGVSVSLFVFILGRSKGSVHLIVLVGIVLGTFFRSLTSLLNTIMDPGEFLAVQDASTASFAMINEASLGITAVVTLVVGIEIWMKAPRWDLMSFGPDVCTSLGLNYKREVRLALTAAAVLVACATALVGPLMFFGLLVTNIAIYALKSQGLRDLLVGGGAIGIIVLVGGQAILEFVLGRATILPVILELVGGTMLLIMLLKEARK